MCFAAGMAFSEVGAQLQVGPSQRHRGLAKQMETAGSQSESEGASSRVAAGESTSTLAPADGPVALRPARPSEPGRGAIAPESENMIRGVVSSDTDSSDSGSSLPAELWTKILDARGCAYD